MSETPVLGVDTNPTHCPEAEPHDLGAMDFPCKHQVIGVHRVFQVFSDPMSSSFCHKEMDPFGLSCSHLVALCDFLVSYGFKWKKIYFK